jgi:hypothetical protein
MAARHGDRRRNGCRRAAPAQAARSQTARGARRGPRERNPLDIFIQECRKGSLKLVIVYNQNLKWQCLSFDALRVFDRNDDLFTLRRV